MKNILFVELSREYKALRKEIDSKVAKVLDSGRFLLGPECAKFEEAFAKYCGIKFCVGVASGTEAVALALMASGTGHGDLVITAANTAVPTVSAISMSGAEPLFVDIDEKTMLMSPESLQICLKKMPKAILKRIKAIIPVHLYGLMCAMDEIKAIADKYKIAIIEDCAQAHGAEYKGKRAGTIGMFGCYSFYPSKNLGCYGDGGAVIVDNTKLYEKLTMLRNYGQTDRYNHEIIGINSRLSELQSAILNVKLKYLDAWNARRRFLAQMYTNGLKDYNVWFQEFRQQERSHVYHLMVLRSDKRQSLVKYLSEQGIHTLIHYPRPVYLQKAYRNIIYRKNSCKIAERTCKQIFSIPLYPFLKDKEAKFIVDKLRRFLK
ncbi:MAG: DegT/DnrJ/EryC1/StrS family aminotransferase [Candidatus Omnitrophica bacterium]|nr:DegT/DnrJ/EryC1/StrS family aminotransferase [Candidatus Omnitrophota bacterium]